MADILIVNGVVVTVDPGRRVLEDGRSRSPATGSPRSARPPR